MIIDYLFAMALSYRKSFDILLVFTNLFLISLILFMYNSRDNKQAPRLFPKIFRQTSSIQSKFSVKIIISAHAAAPKTAPALLSRLDPKALRQPADSLLPETRALLDI